MPVFTRATVPPKFSSAFGRGGGFINTEVFGDEELVFGLLRLGDYLENTAAPMRAAKAISKADMRERFVTDTDPNGDDWMPLDPDYVQKKATMPNLRTHAEDILTLSRRMETAAQSEAAWVATDDTLVFKTDVLPDYWGVHQFGSDASGQAGFAADFRERIRSGAMEEGGGGARDSFGIGRGKATPARPFIGLGADAEEQIIKAFDLWFDEGVAVSISSAGIVQGRGAGGRFGQQLLPDF